jgi:hypothetical protein
MVNRSPNLLGHYYAAPTVGVLASVFFPLSSARSGSPQG